MTLYQWRNIFIKRILLPIQRKMYGRLGKNTIIISPVRISGKKNIFIGNDVSIKHHARIEALTEYGNTVLKSQLEIGNNVAIEQRVHIVCAEHIRIDHDVTISSDVMILDNAHGKSMTNIHALKQPLETNPVSIGAYSLIGAGAKILKGVDIGENCIIGANAVVTHDIPSYSIAAGIPAKVIKQFNFDREEWMSV